MAKPRLQRCADAAVAWEVKRRSWLPAHLAPKALSHDAWQALYALRMSDLPVSKHTIEGVHVAQAHVDALARRGLATTYRGPHGRMAGITAEGRARVAKPVLPPSLRDERVERRAPA